MPELEQKTFQKRQIAYKVRIIDIVNGKFIRDGLSAGYIKLNNNNISRVNIIANIVYKPEQSLAQNGAVIDDGTGRISLRSFDNNGAFAEVGVGDFVLVIGKVREFNNDKYILPEILKKLNSIEWVNVRKSELANDYYNGNDTKTENNEPVEEISGSANEMIYKLIKNLDNGEGVAVEEVIKNSNDGKAEDIITKLLEAGEIFEIKPGKVKVLE